MIGAYESGQLNWPATIVRHQCPLEHPILPGIPYCAPENFHNTPSLQPLQVDTPAYRQWPWRGFAFCSDLGTVGYLLNKPKFGILGWALALPYYLYALACQPTGQQRNQELLYQSTANGVLPFLEAKAGVAAGGMLAIQAIKKNSMPVFGLLTHSMIKVMGGIIALLALTPVLGDPISNWVVRQYAFNRENS